MKRTIQRLAALTLTALMACPIFLSAEQTDDYIVSDPARGAYNGTAAAPATISNLNFTDVPMNHWARQVITREGALNLVKGYDRAYQPEGRVTNQEAIAFILRATGYEVQAVQKGAELAAQYPAEPTGSLWYLGYLFYAQEQGLITAADNSGAQPNAAPTVNFDKNAPAAREDVANWIYIALNAKKADTLKPAPIQKLFTFSDWQLVSAARTIPVEAVATAGIMTGSDGRFNPLSAVTRAEMAQILSNMDSIYFNVMGYVRREGTVGAMRDKQADQTAQYALTREIYVRSGDGLKDVLRFAYEQNTSPQRATLDAVVYRDGQITGLAALEEGDQIEYIVSPADDAVLYVYVKKLMTTREVTGVLHALDAGGKKITVRGADDKTYTYSLAEGLITQLSGANALEMSGKSYPVSTLPYGASVKLRLRNDTVTQIDYVGQPVLVKEMGGVVVENDPDMGYLTILDANGKQVTKQYTEENMPVRKRQYYDNEDRIGYIVRMFPNFEYDPLATTIDDIEPGDVVFLTLNADDPNTIDAVSASTNYQMRYGKIRSIQRGGDTFTVLVEYENKQTAAFEVPTGVFISRGGKPITQAGIQTGDWARFLINEAILEPGHTIESVKEITVEGSEHFISGLYKGVLTGVNAIQNTIALEGAQTLAKTGWVDYRDIMDFNIKNKDIEYYYDGKRVSLDFAAKNLKNGGATAYIATETAYSGERVTKVTFRAGRDEALEPDTAMDANGGGAFQILSHVGQIGTDDGTIVRRHGRLADGNDVMPGDYVRVVLNGGGKAAIVDISDAPDTSKVMIARARIASVNDGKSFKTQSVSQLTGINWIYTPVQREYAIDGKTVFIDADGIADSAKFIGYTEDSVVDRVYNIITDGARAQYVIDAPYASRALRGTVYAKPDGGLSIKDVYVMDDKTNQWRPVSARDNTATITLYPNSIIAKNNAVIPARSLEIGDSLLIMTNAVPATLTTGMTLDGYIVVVER